MQKRVLMLLIPILLSSPAGFVYATTATLVSGAISTNTVWTEAQSPYVVQGSLTVASGAILTINPGVVVKLDMPQFFQAFNVAGALNVQGAADNKVYFTSLKDDSVGNDTNGDGAASSPKAQDW